MVGVTCSGARLAEFVYGWPEPPPDVCDEELLMVTVSSARLVVVIPESFAGRVRVVTVSEG